MANDRNQTAILNRGLRIFFSEFVRVTLSRPSQAVFFLKVVWRQMRAARRRKSNEKRGVHIPPIAIFSITNRCNLRCKGCYAQALREASPDELSARRIREIIVEAEGLGVSFFVIAGGEPLLRPEIIDITRDVPRALFLVVTNGLLLDAPLVLRLQEQQNTVPALSLEGTSAETDGRRGEGVHARLSEKMRELRKAGVFFSLSITLNRSNFDVVTDRTFLREAIEAGCRFFLFLEYTPIKENTEDWVLTADQRQAMKDLLVLFRRHYKAVFIGVPWDEEESGGCLASGRGFVHINAAGDLEPCPFAPFSDVNLKETGLAEALQSNFLKKLRENHDRFAEVSGGCALWKNREWVGSVLEKNSP
jgi:MoaA/NifB/PqqE/SkfB family radical SAM enzyme